MSKFKVTIRQRVIEEKVVIVEAASRAEARDHADLFIENGDYFEFVEIPDRWIDDIEEIKESEDEQA